MPFILALFIAVILNPLVQHMVRWRVPRVLAVSILMTIIVMAMVSLLAYLGSALNELTRTLPQYRNSIMTPLQALEPLLQRVGIDVSVDQLAHYIDPNAAMTLLTNLLTQLSNAMSSIFLLLLTVLFMLLEVPQLPGKFQQMMARPVEGMAVIQRAIDSVFSLSGAKNSHQHHHRPGRLGDARRTRCSLRFCLGIAGLCA